jgi:NitT/TauT family transport system substrate-binding protein
MTADSVAVFADSDIAAVVAYEPFFSQMKKTLAARKPHLVVSSADYPGYIVDVIIVRQADLAANPDKYRKFLKALYRAQNYFETNRDEFVKLAAPHFNLSVADFEDSIRGTLVYHSLSDAKAELGTPSSPGALYKVFNVLMDLNLANGAADEKLSTQESINNSIIETVTP